MSGTIALRTTAPYPAFIAGQGLITVGMTDIPNLFPETQAIIAASPIPVDPIAAYWINLAIFELKNRNLPYVQMAYFVALLQRYISSGYVLWSMLDVDPAAADNTGPLTALPAGILVIGDTPGVINFSGPVTWGQIWLLLDSSMQLVCTGTEPDTPVIIDSGNDIGIIGLNLTLPLPSQGLAISNCTGLNIQTATFTRASDMTTYGILQTIVSDHVAIVSIPANMPDLLTVYDQTQTSGRFARRYLPDSPSTRIRPIARRCGVRRLPLVFPARRSISARACGRSQSSIPSAARAGWSAIGLASSPSTAASPCCSSPLAERPDRRRQHARELALRADQYHQPDLDRLAHPAAAGRGLDHQRRRRAVRRLH